MTHDLTHDNNVSNAVVIKRIITGLNFIRNNQKWPGAITLSNKVFGKERFQGQKPFLLKGRGTAAKTTFGEVLSSMTLQMDILMVTNQRTKCLDLDSAFHFILHLQNNTVFEKSLAGNL